MIARVQSPKSRLQIVGPGITWLTASSFVNSSGLSQRRRSTRIRYANGRTPPNPDSAISENATNSASGEIAERLTLGAAGRLIF